MKNKFTKIAEILRMIPEDEPITYSRLATIFEELGKMEDVKKKKITKRQIK